MKRNFVLWLMVACAATPCAFSQNAQSPGGQSREDDVRETVFRYQFSNLSFQVAFYFISVDNKNPSPAFLDRFRENQPIVRPASDAKYEKKPIPGFVDKKTAKQGLMFRQGAVRWTSETQAEVEGGYECGELCDAANGVYHVSRDGNQWKVESFEPAAKPRA